MGMFGADLDGMQRLESEFTTDTQQVRELQSRITQVLTQTEWTGPAADRFRSEWQSSFSPALVRLMQALEESSSEIRRRRDAIAQATA